MKKSLKILKFGYKLLIVYFIYCLIFAYLPYIKGKELSSESKTTIQTKLESPADNNLKVKYIDEGEDALQTRLAVIKKAESTLDMSTYLIKNDESSDLIIGGLLDAADRGVKVRMIVDGKMNGMSRTYKYKLSHHPNIELKYYNPFHLLKPWKWNATLHDKYLKVDNKYLLIGGRNIGNQYYKPGRHYTQDMEVLIYDELGDSQLMADINTFILLIHESKDAIAKKQPNWHIKKDDFEHRFIFYEPDDSLLNPEKMIEVEDVKIFHNDISTMMKEPKIGYLYQLIANGAKESVTVQSPYATPTKVILDSFKSSSDNHIKLDYLTNSESSSPNYPAFSSYLSNRRQFLRTGINIYEFQSDGDTSLHTKLMVVDDDKNIVGSFNLDNRSLYLNTETVVYVKGQEATNSLNQKVNKKKNMSLLVGLDNNYVQNELVEEGDVSLIKKVLMFVVGVVSKVFEPLI
ncbi:MAG: phosphatidylserine/phosphatidylglycerophosphate/cardiolipin synthase family protein [Erysipelothrix sp.]